MFTWVFENGELPQPGSLSIPPPSASTDEAKAVPECIELAKDEAKTEESINGAIGAFVEEDTTVPSTEDQEEAAKNRRKLAFVSLEVLVTECSRLQEAILHHSDSGLQQLWDIVYLPKDASIPAHLSVAYGKIFTSLISRKTRPTLLFFLEQKNVVQAMLSHLDDTFVLDILLKMLCLEEMAEGQGVSQWLHEQQLVSCLVDHLAPQYGYETHSSVSQVLLHILAIAQAPLSADPNPTPRCFSLVKELTCEYTLSRIMDFMLDPILPESADPDTPASQLISSLTFGVTIFIEIIRRHYLDSDNEPSSKDSPTPTTTPAPIVDLGILVSIITRRLPDLVKLLCQPRSVTKAITNTVSEFVPLGFERLKVCELIAELLHGSNMKALNLAPAPLSPSDIKVLLEKREAYLDPMSQTSLSAPQSATQDLDHEGSPPTSLKQFTSSKFDQFGGLSENSLPDIGGLAISSNPQVSIGEWAKLCILEHGILTVFLDLFMTYTWNNFLHVVVFDIIHQVLNLPTDNPTNLALIASLFIDARLTERIVSAQRLNDAHVQEPKGVRLGFMGYLTFIAEETVKLLDRAGYELGHNILSMAQAPEWQEYIYQSLRDTKQRDMEPLDGNLASYGSQPTSLLGDLATSTASDPHFASSDSQPDQPLAGPNSASAEQMVGQLPDHFSNLDPASFTNGSWGVDDDDDDDDDEDDEEGVGFRGPVHIADRPSSP
ncbi:sporulation-induced protein [Entomophthora muscae]|uniref:Sporulation-induced protein n=1 Tax=Entomophthora muscae TaxID=34485 RepID=A0ACC2SC97_9FUNG|nr:sporulation-induced protein [Entomophthora muscae]